MSNIRTQRGEIVREPRFIQWLMNDPRASWIWLPLRLWLGAKWIDAATHKLGNAAWVETGFAVKGFWEGAVAIPETGRPAISFDWYRNFLQSLLDAEAYSWLAPLVAYGELLIGIALILGVFTGIAAFFGAFMNWNFMMAGSASSNPVLLMIAIGLILAWKVAGFVGLDFFLLYHLGTPWKNSDKADNLENVAAKT